MPSPSDGPPATAFGHRALDHRHEIHVPQSRRTAGARHQLEGAGRAVSHGQAAQFRGTQVAERSDPPSSSLKPAAGTPWPDAGVAPKAVMQRAASTVNTAAVRRLRCGRFMTRPDRSPAVHLDSIVGSKSGEDRVVERPVGERQVHSGRHHAEHAPVARRHEHDVVGVVPRDEDRAGPADTICREPGERDRTRFEACVIGVRDR